MNNSGWQPIETAPRSTLHTINRVLVWIESAKSEAFGAVYDDGEGGIVVQISGYYGDWSATHWQPLPGAPK